MVPERTLASTSSWPLKVPGRSATRTEAADAVVRKQILSSSWAGRRRKDPPRWQVGWSLLSAHFAAVARAIRRFACYCAKILAWSHAAFEVSFRQACAERFPQRAGLIHPDLPDGLVEFSW